MADEDETDEQPDGLPNAATEQGVRAQRKGARQRRKEQDDVLRAMLSTAQGRRVFYDIVFNLCGLNDPLTSPALSDGYTLFREGARQVGLDLQTRALQAARQQYMVLLAENLPNP